VAVLKLSPKNVNSLKDKLICLPLGRLGPVPTRPGAVDGPTIDEFGKVIGINVAVKMSEKDILGRPAPAAGYNVAIPINLAR
jgi:S1-C subfamily serine protease